MAACRKYPEVMALRKRAVGHQRAARECETAEANLPAHAVHVATAGEDVVLVAIHDTEQLLANVLCSSERASLDEVLDTPRAAV